LFDGLQILHPHQEIAAQVAGHCPQPGLQGGHQSAFGAGTQGSNRVQWAS
jgi:hypothetical protein